MLTTYNQNHPLLNPQKTSWWLSNLYIYITTKMHLFIFLMKKNNKLPSYLTNSQIISQETVNQLFYKDGLTHKSVSMNLHNRWSSLFYLDMYFVISMLLEEM
jgi:hypothetical protein